MLTNKEHQLLDEASKMLGEKSRIVSFTCFLKKYGYKRIGEGAYGVVYGKRGVSNVIKIVESCLNDCYLSYAQYAFNNNLSNRYLPKIYAVIPLEYFHIVVMERLHHRKGAFAKKFAKHFRRHYLNDDDNNIQENFLLPRSSVNRKSSLISIQRIGNRIINKWKRENGKYHEEVFWDLWPQNIMFRKTGNRFQTVITDPIAG